MRSACWALLVFVAVVPAHAGSAAQGAHRPQNLDPAPAAPAPVSEPMQGNAAKWSGFVFGGEAFRGRTNYTVNLANGGTALDNDTAGGSPVFGAETDYEFWDYFRLGAVFEWSKYNYSDGTAADTELSFYLLPSAQARVGAVTFWAGVGIGFVRASIGASAATAGNISTTVDSSSLGFAWSPRIGVDYEIFDGWLVGAQCSYTWTKATLNGSAGNVVLNPLSSAFTEDYTRSWIAVAARIGKRF